jgi:hypothetical protein
MVRVQDDSFGHVYQVVLYIYVTEFFNLNLSMLFVRAMLARLELVKRNSITHNFK